MYESFDEWIKQQGLHAERPMLWDCWSAACKWSSARVWALENRLCELERRAERHDEFEREQSEQL